MKKVLKKILSEKNPFAIMRRKRMRDNLQNMNPTLLCPNCLGGILFHDLGLRFNSPTVNLMMTQTDFAQFVMNMKDFLNGTFDFFQHEEYVCPCARLKTKSGKQIVIHFTHYHSEEEALQKWNTRTRRIDYQNMFVCLMERDGLTRDDIVALSKLDVKGLVVFTVNSYPDIPYTVLVHERDEKGEVGNLLAKRVLDDSRKYEEYFDFVKWFNEANGFPYNNVSYVK